MKFGRSLPLSCGILLCFVAQVLLAGNTEIVVDLETRTTEPRAPVVNIRALDSIALRIKGQEAARAQLAMAVFLIDTEGEPKPVPKDSFVPGTGFVLNFRECEDSIARLQNMISRNVRELPCPFAVQDAGGGASWTVYSQPGALLVRIYAVLPDGKLGLVETPVVVQLESRPFVLDWSVGLSFFNRRDREYRVAPVSGTDRAEFTAVSEGAIPYQFSAFAHYALARNPAWALTGGFGVDVPVERLTTMVGLTRSFRTVPIANSAHVTAGVAYSYRKELKPEYQGVEDIPAELTADNLTEDKAALGAFLSVSFGFWGGEDKFKGIYSASPPK